MNTNLHEWFKPQMNTDTHRFFVEPPVCHRQAEYTEQHGKGEMSLSVPSVLPVVGNVSSIIIQNSPQGDIMPDNNNEPPKGELLPEATNRKIRIVKRSESEVDFMVSQNAIPSRKHLGGCLPEVDGFKKEESLNG